MLKKIILAFAAAALLIGCTGNKVTGPEAAFASVIDTLSVGSHYAVVEIGEPLLLVADGVYQWNPDSPDTLCAIGAKAFSIDSTGTVIDHGIIQSQGTNYPFSTIDGCLLVAGHHFAMRMAILEDGELTIRENLTENYSNEGETVDYYYTGVDGVEKKIDANTYSELLGENEKAEIINFQSEKK